MLFFYFNKLLPSSFVIDGEKITHKHRTNANAFIVMISKDDELQLILLCKTIQTKKHIKINLRKQASTAKTVYALC